MGWLDKAKSLLGIEPEVDELVERADRPKRARPGRGERPPLRDDVSAPQQSLDDVLEARASGDIAGMRKLLKEMDRGSGLRTVLRAAAALEAADEGELATLLPKVRAEEPAWKLPLQLAAALDDGERAAGLAAQAIDLGAPAWARAWYRALRGERAGLVDLLFADPALARTVAARDLKIAGAVAESEATARYVSFAYGRDCIKRFGAAAVAALHDRAEAP